MFDLEQAIAQWRRQMLDAGIRTPVPLEELESHLREDIEQLTRSGLNARRAYEVAVQNIGAGRQLNREFKKGHMKKTALIIIGFVVFAVGMALVTPAMAHYRDHGAMTAENLRNLLLGLVITGAGIGTAAWSFKKRQA